MTKELIEKIEDAHRRVRKIGPDAIYETELREVLRAAADALSARQPSEDGEYILKLIETIKETGGSVEIHGVKILPCDEFGRTAAVPDAATEQVEAAAKALHETRNPWFAAYGDWGAAGFEIKQAFRESARAALVAAQGAAPPVNSFDTTAEREKTGADSLHVAPQEPSRLPDFFAPKPMPNSYVPAPVLPSSGIDEYALANLIHSTSVAHFGGLDPRVAPIIARAVAEWLKGQGGESRGE